MNQTDKNTKMLATASIIGATYAALTVVMGDLAYGPLQFRFAEALCILPFFLPASAWGLFVGCIIANLVGGYGPFDIVFGSLATLLACLCIAGIGKGARAQLERTGGVSWKKCIAACAMPTVFNAPIIGVVLAFSIEGLPFWEGVVTYGAQVGAGEAIVLFAAGLPLMRFLIKNEKYRNLLQGD